MAHPIFDVLCAPSSSEEGDGWRPRRSRTDVSRPSPALPDSDAELLARVRNGDVQAFRQIYDQYAEGLLRFAERFASTTAGAEDLVHDVLLWLWERRTTLVVHGSLRIYLFSAVRHRALDRLRHDRVIQANATRFTDDAAANAPAEEPLTAELDAAALRTVLDRALAELTERQRAILTLRWHQGMGYAEIAEVMGISPDAAKQQVSRLQRSLRPLLERFRQE